MLLCPEGPLDRFGTTLDSILEPFWGHFEVILSSFRIDFRRFSVRCPILFERCSWCWVFPLTSFVFSGFYNRNVKEEDKKKEKEKAKEICRPSGLLSACFGNPEC